MADALRRSPHDDGKLHFPVTRNGTFGQGAFIKDGGDGFLAHIGGEALLGQPTSVRAWPGMRSIKVAAALPLPAGLEVFEPVASDSPANRAVVLCACRALIAAQALLAQWHRLLEPKGFLLFSCLGRGPYFYNGTDRDLKVITQTFPHMPLLGFYGNSEIAHLNGSNQLLPYSAVLSLFAAP